MSLFRRSPNAATLEYESWSTTATDARAAAAAGADATPVTTAGRSRTGPQHLESAVRALDAAAARRSE